MTRKLGIALLVLVLFGALLSTVLGKGGPPDPLESPLPEAAPQVFKSPLADLWTYELRMIEVDVQRFVIDAGWECTHDAYDLWLNVCPIGETSCSYTPAGGATKIFTDTYWTGYRYFYWGDYDEPTPLPGQYVTWYWDCQPSSGSYWFGIDSQIALGRLFLPLVLRGG